MNSINIFKAPRYFGPKKAFLPEMLWQLPSLCWLSRHRSMCRPAWLKITKKVAWWNLDGLCDPQQGFDGNNLLATFDFAKIFRVQINFFGQFLLGEPGLFSAAANRLANNLPVPQERLSFGIAHNCQKLDKMNPEFTPATCWYFCLLFCLHCSPAFGNHGRVGSVGTKFNALYIKLSACWRGRIAHLEILRLPYYCGASPENHCRARFAAVFTPMASVRSYPIPMREFAL